MQVNDLERDELVYLVRGACKSQKLDYDTLLELGTAFVRSNVKSYNPVIDAQLNHYDIRLDSLFLLGRGLISNHHKNSIRRIRKIAFELLQSPKIEKAAIVYFKKCQDRSLPYVESVEISQ